MKRQIDLQRDKSLFTVSRVPVRPQQEATIIRMFDIHLPIRVYELPDLRLSSSIGFEAVERGPSYLLELLF